MTIMYFKIILNFITDYRLETKVNSEDGSVEIVGINSQGFEVFKFALDDKRTELLGIKNQSQLDGKADGGN